MFKGVIHANMRRVLPFFIQKMPKRVVNVCSGNFTLETMLRMNGFAGQLESCDVSLYSCMVGSCLAKQLLDVKFSEQADPDLQVFSKYLGTPEGNAAVVAICLDLSEHAKRNNGFQKRVWSATVGAADYLVKQTIDRLNKKREIVSLDRFHARDGVEVIRSLKGEKDVLVMTSPPTYEKGYEKLYEWMDKTFVWPKPGYTDIGPRQEFAKVVLENCSQWMFFTEDRNDEMEAVVGKPVVQASRGANKNVYLYSSLQVSPKVVRRQVETEPYPFERLTDHVEITPESKLGFTRLNFKQANYFRQLYSSVIPMQAAATFCYGFTIDGRVFGQVMLSIATLDPVVDGKSIGGRYIYMMSDLPVSSDRHPRLSKLVLACTTSIEFKAELEKRMLSACDYVFTTAFSENPVSMKYRGAYDFHSRKPKDEKGHYAINYVARTGQKNLEQLFRDWHAKHYAAQKVPKKDETHDQKSNATGSPRRLEQENNVEKSQ